MGDRVIEEWQRLHRDAEGRPLLVGPDCPDCEREAVVTYKCLRCLRTWDVPGVFTWSWQGKVHAHELCEIWEQKLGEHYDECGGVVVPAGSVWDGPRLR